MVRINLIFLAALVACALSLVTSRHQARQLFVELEREQATARGYEVEYGQLQLPAPGRVRVLDGSQR
jgi:cell division protein FtsL